MFMPRVYYERYKELGYTTEEIIAKWKEELLLRNTTYGLMISDYSDNGRKHNNSLSGEYESSRND